MPLKSQLFKIFGMQLDRDVAIANSNPDSNLYAFELKNMRLITDESNSSVCLTNEKGTREVTVTGDLLPVDSVPLGTAVIDDNLVLFSTSSVKNSSITAGSGVTSTITVSATPSLPTITPATFNDSIHKLAISGDNLVSTKLFTGHLNFNIDNPIECKTSVDSDSNKKVYWIDGVNVPRCVDITENYVDNLNSLFDSTLFMVLPNSAITITKNYGTGQFPAGTVQYLITLVSKTGAETAPCYLSPLYYTSYDSTRAGKADEVCANNFTIKINNLRNPATHLGAPININLFRYIRVYSIIKTTAEDAGTARLVKEIELNEPVQAGHPVGKTYTIVDYNEGESYDMSDTLFLGSQFMVPQTFTVKDGVMFYGNYNLGTIQQVTIPEGTTISVSCDAKNAGTEDEDRYLLNSSLITTFKSGESYRLGVIAQDSKGRTSNVIWLSDVTQTNRPSVSSLQVYNTEFKLSGNDYTTLRDLVLSKGYKYLIPVVVYPSESNRECICLGYVQPTLYSESTVKENIYALPSYLILWKYNKPLSHLDAYGSDHTFPPYNVVDSYPYRIFSDADTSNIIPCSRHRMMLAGGILGLFSVYDKPLGTRTIITALHTATLSSSYGKIMGKVIKGSTRLLSSIDLSRYAYAINPNIEFTNLINSLHTLNLVRTNNGTIDFVPFMLSDTESYYEQTPFSSTSYPETDPFVDYLITGTTGYSGTWSEGGVTYNSFGPLNYNFHDANCNMYGGKDSPAINENICTLHSPDIELANRNYNLDYSQLRLVGNCKLNENNILYSNLLLANGSTGSKSYADKLTFSNNKLRYHAEGDTDSSSSTVGTAKIDFYVNKWNPSSLTYNYTYDAENVDGFIKDVTALKNITAEKLSAETKYFANTTGTYLTIPYVDLEFVKTNDLINGKPVLVNIDRTITYDLISKSKQNDTGLVAGNVLIEGSTKVGTKKVRRVIQNPKSSLMSLLYKTTPYIIFKYNNNEILPVYGTDYTGIGDAKYGINSPYDYLLHYENNHPKNPTGTGDVNKAVYYHTATNVYGESGTVKQTVLYNNANSQYLDTGLTNDSKYIWLAEVYRTVNNKFGGTDDATIQSQLWNLGGPIVDLSSANELVWNEGDCYFEKFLSVKSYAHDEEAVNANIDILELRCESWVNPLSRSDIHINDADNTTADPESNFNLHNDVYSNNKKYKQLQGLQTEDFVNKNFPNLVTWTKTKLLNAKVDEWLHITMASIYDVLNNSKYISKLEKWRDSLLIIQDHNLSELLYNSNVLIESTLGLPIELAKSFKVSGLRALYDIGAKSKWEVNLNPVGLFFLETDTNLLYLISEGPVNVSLSKGMSTWFKQQKRINNWKVLNNAGNKLYYDYWNEELNIMNDQVCLTYGGPTKLEFVSLYDYNDVPFLELVNHKNIFVTKDCKFFEKNAGSYNNYFGTYKPFWIDVIADLEYALYKTYCNVIYDGDSFSTSTTPTDLSWDGVFNLIQASNEHLNSGLVNAVHTGHIPSNKEYRFRKWALNIPRLAGSRDRITNLWARILLKRNTPTGGTNDLKSVIHDFVVTYLG